MNRALCVAESSMDMKARFFGGKRGRLSLVAKRRSRTQRRHPTLLFMLQILAGTELETDHPPPLLMYTRRNDVSRLVRSPSRVWFVHFARVILIFFFVFVFALCFLLVGGRGPARVGNGEPASSVHLQRRPRRSHGEELFVA